MTFSIIALGITMSTTIPIPQMSDTLRFTVR